MTVQEIIKKAIPTADDRLCEYILWGRTPYPCGEISVRSLYRAANRWKRAQDNGHRLCEFCDRIVTSKMMVCPRCDGERMKPFP